MEKVRGIITKCKDFRENDKLLNLFTLEEGMLFVTSYGARGAKSEMTAASQLFVYGEFMLNVKNNMITLKSAIVDEAFSPIYADYDRYRVGCAMLIAINAAMNDNERSEAAYSLLHYALSFLAYSDSNHLDLLSGFLLKLMQCMGFCPATTHCANCGKDLRHGSYAWFSNSSGGALCDACSSIPGVKRVEPITLEVMRRILLLDSSEISRIRIPERVRNKVVSTILNYSEHVLETKLFKKERPC